MGGQCYNNDHKNTICTYTFVHSNSYKYIYVFLLPLLNVHIPKYDRHVILHWGVITMSHSLRCVRHATFQSMIAMSYLVGVWLPSHTPYEVVIFPCSRVWSPCHTPSEHDHHVTLLRNVFNHRIIDARSSYLTFKCSYLHDIHAYHM